MVRYMNHIRMQGSSSLCSLGTGCILLLAVWTVIRAQPMGKLYKESYANTYAALNVRNALDKLINVLQSPQEKRSMFVRTGAAAAAAARDRARPTETPSSPSAASTAAPAFAKIGSSTRPVSPGSSGASAFDSYVAGGAQETCASSRLSGSSHGRGSHLAANYHEPSASYHGSSSSASESDTFYGNDGHHDAAKSRDQYKIRGSTPPLTQSHLGKKTHVRDGSQTSEYSENCEFVGHIPPLLHDKIWKRSLRGPPVGSKTRVPTPQGQPDIRKPEEGWNCNPCKSWTSPLGGIFPSRPFT